MKYRMYKKPINKAGARTFLAFNDWVLAAEGWLSLPSVPLPNFLLCVSEFCLQGQFMMD